MLGLWNKLLLPHHFRDEDRMSRRADSVQVDFHHAFGELGNKRMFPSEVLAFPAPTESRELREGESHIFESDFLGKTFALGKMTVEDDHGSDM